MFLAAVISFAVGIGLEALYPCPLAPLFAALLLPLPFIPFIIAKRPCLVVCLMIPLFLLAGMVRLGAVTLTLTPVAQDGEKGIYEAEVIETSPNTKVVRILKPADVAEVKAIFRTDKAVTISDRVRVWGELKELRLTFNNPSLMSWKWMKRLEGVSYELKGMLLTSTPGRNHIHAWRDLLGKRIERSGAVYPAVLKALTIGDTTGLDEGTKTLFQRTGTSHILAISGSNIGIVTAFFFFLARTLIRRHSRLRQRGDDIRYAALLSIPFAIIFMVTAGSSIPTIRATIMISVFMIALFFERGTHTVNTVALAALVILLLYPYSLFSPSFQLTFASVFFIVLGTERVYSVFRPENRILRWFISSVLMTAAATAGTLPIVVYHFYGMNPFAVLHNLIAVPPMCIVAMPLTLIGVILPWGGETLLRLAGETVSFTITMLRYLDFGYLYPLIRPTLFECLLYYVLLLSLIYMQSRLVLAGLVLVLLPLSSAYGYYAYRERTHNRTLCVDFIDVGLGDAMLIEAPQGVRILVDGGGQPRGDFDTGKSVITPILLAKKIRTLDYVINTHPHGDHAGGLVSILRTFKVRRFITGAYFGKEPGFIDLITVAREKGIPVEIWKTGEERDVGGAKLRALSPNRGRSAENANNASLVLKLTHGTHSFLLTGDIDREVEEELILKGSPLRAHVLKVPHHGSRFSSTLPFLRSVRPDLAVLSVGKGIKGLPGEEALRNYHYLSIPLMRTDQNGFIQVCSDGRRLTCSPFRGR